MKRFLEKFNDYRYKKRLKKWFIINLQLAKRKFLRFFVSNRTKGAICSVPAIMSYVSIAVIVLVSVGNVYFVKHGRTIFNTEERTLRRLAMQEYDENIAYLRALEAVGSSNRIQIKLKTDGKNGWLDNENGLDRGGVNLIVTFSDGNSTEYALNNSNYDNFENGMEDSFTLILPFGYTPFDVTDYTINVLPDINNVYDTWRCKWARVYFLMENTPTLLASEDWEDVAVFGDGENAVRSSILKIVSEESEQYNRIKTVYGYYYKMAADGATEFMSAQLKADTLDALGINGGKYLYIDIETVNIEMQNNALTYYTKGVDITESDSLDYDGRIFLDVTYYSENKNGSYTDSFELDTLGTDDFELGTTQTFKLEFPEGTCVFDIATMSIRVENPDDSWSPHFIRAYVKPDYCDLLEIGRITDNMLIDRFATPIFKTGLIDGVVDFDLTMNFGVSTAYKNWFEREKQFSFGAVLSKMYFSQMSFYDRQNMFFEKATELYSGVVYNEVEAEQTDDENTVVTEE